MDIYRWLHRLVTWDARASGSSKWDSRLVEAEYDTEARAMTDTPHKQDWEPRRGIAAVLAESHTARRAATLCFHWHYRPPSKYAPPTQKEGLYAQKGESLVG
jgi:hypothetical protein